MSKTTSTFLIIIFLIIGYLFNIDGYIKKKISHFSNAVSDNIINTTNIAKFSFNKYLNQVSYIKDLEKQNNNNNIFKVKYNIAQTKLNEQNKLLNLKYNKDIDFESVKILSYLNFNDNSKVIIKSDFTLEENKIYPLISYDGFSCGILINKNLQNIGYLNNNVKCNYTVFIGDENAPGITHGTNKYGELFINYIPLWKNIKIGDEIITSGMDNIFPYGIKVGKVISISRSKITQKVIASTYSNYLGSRYLYLIK